MNFLENTKSIFFKSTKIPETLSNFLIALDNDFEKSLNGWETYTPENEIGTSGVFYVQNFKDYNNLKFTITIGKVDTGTFNSLEGIGKRVLDLYNDHEFLMLAVLKNAPTITKVLNELNVKQFNLTSFKIVQDPNFDGNVNDNPFLIIITLWHDILGFDIKISITNEQLG